MAKWKSEVFKGKDGKEIRVQIPVDVAAKLKAGEKHESAVLGLWKPGEDKEYQAALKQVEAGKKKVEAGKIAKMNQR